MRRIGIVMMMAAAATFATLPAQAARKSPPSQQEQGAGNGEASPDCQAEPRQKPSRDDDKTGSITKKLDECGGVLQPPDVNDPGLVKPAPETGNMPVIKPGQVPGQAPKKK